jgi:hypothetical protein
MLEWDNYDKHKKDDAPDFYDDRLEQFKEQEWNRRLNGFWFMNNGTPCFITGLYYLYLVWWKIDVGSPSFRIPDLEKFYFLDYCINDPLCMGAVEVTKRRFGKSFVAGLFIVEYVSRTKMAFGGIQSKTGKDAGKFFSKTVVNPFRRLPKFFRPEYDMSLGANPKSEIRFQKTNVRGKKAESQVDKSELGGGIDHQPSDKVAYDGQKIHRYVGDEAGKCFAKGTKVRMWDGSVKNIEDIENGELVMGDDAKYLKEGIDVVIGLYEERPVSIQLPKKIQYKVVEAPPAVKGDSASGNVTKEIKLDNGLTIQAPIFIKEGEEVLVNTETGEYSTRA